MMSNFSPQDVIIASRVGDVRWLEKVSSKFNKFQQIKDKQVGVFSL